MKQIIKTLLTNDLYKFTMQQLILNQYPDVEVEYSFFNRGETPFPKGFGKKLQAQVNGMESLKFSAQELSKLKQAAPFLKTGYLEWLKGFSPDPKQVKITQRGKRLEIKVQGPWHSAIYWEVPLMAMISELYFVETGQKANSTWASDARNKGKTLKSHGVTFADFGLRRRYSSKVQEMVIRMLMGSQKEEGDSAGFVGTSNVELALKFGIKPIGTMAHELPMVFAALHGFDLANKRMLNAWRKEYNGDLGIALTDTFTTEVFLRAFGKKIAEIFDGVRQDSRSPEDFADRIIAHYKSLGIDPRTKTIVFSDGLSTKRAIEVTNYCKGKINCPTGIGTHFTNDVGVRPLNIVIKVTKARRGKGPFIPTIKLSDSPGKVTGDKKMVRKAKATLNI